METIKAHKLAIKYSPPTLVVAYSSIRDGVRQNFHRHIRFRDLRNASTDSIVAKLRRKYGAYFTEAVKDEQIRTLVEALRNHQDSSVREGKPSAQSESSRPVAGSAPAVPVGGPAESDFKSASASLGDLQRVSASELVKAKSIMERAFESNRLRPGDPGYVYNVEVDFSSGSDDNDWDESGSEA